MTDRDRVVRELHALSRGGSLCPICAEIGDRACSELALLGMGFDAGRAAERADVVAWLVSEETLPDVPQWAMVAIITRLERGAHQRK